MSFLSELFQWTYPLKENFRNAFQNTLPDVRENKERGEVSHYELRLIDNGEIHLYRVYYPSGVLPEEAFHVSFGRFLITADKDGFAGSLEWNSWDHFEEDLRSGSILFYERYTNGGDGIDTDHVFHMEITADNAVEVNPHYAASSEEDGLIRYDDGSVLLRGLRGFEKPVIHIGQNGKTLLIRFNSVLELQKLLLEDGVRFPVSFFG